MISEKTPVPLGLLLALQGAQIAALVGVFTFLWNQRAEMDSRLVGLDNRFVTKDYAGARFDEVLRRLDRLEAQQTPR